MRHLPPIVPSGVGVGRVIKNIFFKCLAEASWATYGLCTSFNKPFSTYLSLLGT